VDLRSITLQATFHSDRLRELRAVAHIRAFKYVNASWLPETKMMISYHPPRYLHDADDPFLSANEVSINVETISAAYPANILVATKVLDDALDPIRVGCCVVISNANKLSLASIDSGVQRRNLASFCDINNSQRKRTGGRVLR
jgi:hypothetical protein